MQETSHESILLHFAVGSTTHRRRPDDGQEISPSFADTTGSEGGSQMSSYRFIQLDLFTQQAFAGNALAVFPEAEGLYRPV